MGTTDNPTPVMMKVYKVHSTYWDKFVIADHYDDATEYVHELLETALDNQDIETIIVTIEDMNEDDYRALPEFEGWD